MTTEASRLLHVWHQFGQPSGLAIDKNDLLYVVDETANIQGRDEGRAGHPHQSQALARRAHRQTLDGKIIANVPYRPGQYAGRHRGWTNAGNIYGANTNHPRAVRFMKQ